MGVCKATPKPPAFGSDSGSDTRVDAGGASSQTSKTEAEQNAENAREFTNKCTELFALFATGDDCLDMDLEVRLLRHEITALEHQVSSLRLFPCHQMPHSTNN